MTKKKQTPKKPAKPAQPGAGRNGNVIPPQYHFKPGNKAAVGHGRPRTISALREYIQELGAQPSGHQDLTRLDVLLRQMFGGVGPLGVDPHTSVNYCLDS